LLETTKYILTFYNTFIIDDSILLNQLCRLSWNNYRRPVKAYIIYPIMKTSHSSKQCYTCSCKSSCMGLAPRTCPFEIIVYGVWGACPWDLSLWDYRVWGLGGLPLGLVPLRLSCMGLGGLAPETCPFEITMYGACPWDLSLWDYHVWGLPLRLVPLKLPFLVGYKPHFVPCSTFICSCMLHALKQYISFPIPWSCFNTCFQ
jgi:hypothetical protein